MISGTAAPGTDEDGRVEKKLWVQPVAAKLDLSNAEANDGSGTDGGQIS